MSFWACVDPSTASDTVIVAKLWTAGTQDSPPYQYGVEFGTAAKTADLYFGTSGGVSNGPFSIHLTTGIWTFIAFTYDGTWVRGYRDGAQVLSTECGGSIVARGNALTIGGGSTRAKGFKGQLDDLRIYAVALTEAQIQSDMKTGVGAAGDPVPPGSVTNLRRTDTRP